MTATTIYFLRHGEVHNPKKILYGRLPRFSLSTQGRKKIKELADFFYKENVNIIYTSPMLRARQTTELLVARLGINSKVSRLLTEVKFSFAGISLVEFEKTIQPKLYGLEYIEYIKEGSETIEQIERRMLRFLNLVRKKHKGQKILAVSHGDPMMILKAAVERKPFTWEYKRNNYLKPGDWFKLTI